MTPWRSGRIARIDPGVRPIISFACVPAARTYVVSSLIAITDGSKSTIPSPFTKTTVFAVPKSTARLPRRFPNRREEVSGRGTPFNGNGNHCSSWSGRSKTAEALAAPQSASSRSERHARSEGHLAGGRSRATTQNPAAVTVTGSQSIPAGEIKNGNVSFNVSANPPAQPTPPQAGCPNNNWTAEITDLEFTSATITVTQGGVVVLQQTFTL